MKRVAIYEDVSEQEIKGHSEWELIGTYSGGERERLITDCEAGKIDLIITKSLSCFGRNYEELFDIVHTLLNLPVPLEVFFLREHLFAQREDVERILDLYMQAEEETRLKSKRMHGDRWHRKKLRS